MSHLWPCIGIHFWWNMHIHINILEIEKWSQLLQELLEDNPYIDPQHVTSKLNSQKKKSLSNNFIKYNLFQSHLKMYFIHTFPWWNLTMNNNKYLIPLLKTHMIYTFSHTHLVVAKHFSSNISHNMTHPQTLW